MPPPSPPSGHPTYAVVCLHEKCCQEAAQYIADRLSAPSRSDGGGGAELVVHQEPMRPDGLIVHVSATDARLLQLAEEVGCKKCDRDGVIREFRAGEVDDFPAQADSDCVVGPLTLSDVHRCVIHAMESLHFSREQKHLPGYPKSRIMKQAPVLSAYREAGYVDTFPLHDDEAVSKLHARWTKCGVFSPPVEEIRDYFGENVALYASFSAFYTAFLIPIAAIGLAQFALDRLLGVSFLLSDVAFSCLNLIAVTVFLEMWKRRSAELEFRWGSGGKLRKKRPRPEFRGEVGKNSVTGREEMQYPRSKTMKKVFLVSLPLTFACLALAFFVMLASFQADRYVYGMFVDADSGEFAGGLLGTALTFLPSSIYSVSVLFANQYYLRLAHRLTEWENHRTQEQFESFVVAKLVLFEFVNTFLALFYIAFWLQDVTMLRSQVFSMLIVLQIVNQVQETLLPVFLKRPSTRRAINKVSKKLADKTKVDLTKKEVCQHGEVSNCATLGSEDNRVALANFSLERDPYESTYDDFMELWLQFGHVFLFSSVYPLAAFFALANNLLELRVDAYKMCKLSRKPTPRCVRDIGAWYAAFSVTSVISVMTNCALMFLDPSLRETFAPSSSDRDWVLMFVAVEHAFLLVRVVIDRLISDVPKSVKDAQDRQEFVLANRRKKQADD